MPSERYKYKRAITSGYNIMKTWLQNRVLSRLPHELIISRVSAIKSLRAFQQTFILNAYLLIRHLPRPALPAVWVLCTKCRFLCLYFWNLNEFICALSSSSENSLTPFLEYRDRGLYSQSRDDEQLRIIIILILYQHNMRKYIYKYSRNLINRTNYCR